MGADIAFVAGLAAAVAASYRLTRPWRQAQALLALHGKHQEKPVPPIKQRKQQPETSDEEKAARHIASVAGYWVANVFKVLEPDLDGEYEVLFRGRYKGDQKANIPGESTDELYRCVVRGEGTGYVVSGW